MRFDNYTIKPLEKSDLKAYHQMVQDNRKRLEDFFVGTVSRTKTEADTVRFVDEMVERAQRKEYYAFLIVDEKAHKLAGFLDFKNVDWNIPKAEVGCYIDEHYECRGITTTAFVLLCRYGFDRLGFEKIYLRTHNENKSARRVAEKAGFILEGTIRKDYKTTAGQLVDLLYYGKLKEE